MGRKPKLQTTETPVKRKKRSALKENISNEKEIDEVKIVSDIVIPAEVKIVSDPESIKEDLLREVVFILKNMANTSILRDRILNDRGLVIYKIYQNAVLAVDLIDKGKFDEAKKLLDEVHPVVIDRMKNCGDI